jgi:2-oxoglutarate ferredoxin oxidoreductase subunit gamma
MTNEVRLSGFGGQGIILSGYILGKAVSIYDHRNATLMQSYGPESRGGAAACEVVASDERIDYPKVGTPNVVVALSQEAYTKYGHDLAPGGTLIVEADLVRNPVAPEGCRMFVLPATRMAEELGRKIVANMVMLGFVAAATEVAQAESFREAIRTTVPPGTEALNLRAFQKGYEHYVPGS